jgi:hypothetical protein
MTIGARRHRRREAAGSVGRPGGGQRSPFASRPTLSRSRSRHETAGVFLFHSGAGEGLGTHRPWALSPASRGRAVRIGFPVRWTGGCARRGAVQDRLSAVIYAARVTSPSQDVRWKPLAAPQGVAIDKMHHRNQATYPAPAGLEEIVGLLV